MGGRWIASTNAMISEENSEYKYTFNIPIGDIEYNGHCMVDFYEVSCTHTPEEAAKAYAEAVRKIGRNLPAELCSKPDEYEISEEDSLFLKNLGYKFDNWYNECDPEKDGMADLTMWFITQGNSDIKCKFDNRCEEFSIRLRQIMGRHQVIGYGVYS